MTAALPACCSCERLPIEFDGKSSLCRKYCFKYSNSFPVLGFSGTKEEARKHRAQFCAMHWHIGHLTRTSAWPKRTLTQKGLSPRAERTALTKCHLLLCAPNFLKLKVSQKCNNYAAPLHDYNTDWLTHLDKWGKNKRKEQLQAQESA